MSDELCHGHHVWRTNGNIMECRRCGLIERAEDEGR